jgi:hypothetical protein
MGEGGTRGAGQSIQLLTDAHAPPRMIHGVLRVQVTIQEVYPVPMWTYMVTERIIASRRFGKSHMSSRGS